MRRCYDDLGEEHSRQRESEGPKLGISLEHLGRGKNAGVAMAQ